MTIMQIGLCGVPAQVFQFRDSEEDVLDSMDAVLGQVVASHNGGGVAVECALDRPHVRAVPMDGGLVDIVQRSARALVPEGWEAMHSGAVHDAGMMANKMPAAMLFIPSINGISHDFTEDTHEEDIVTGAHVYAHAAAQMIETFH